MKYVLFCLFPPLLLSAPRLAYFSPFLIHVLFRCVADALLAASLVSEMKPYSIRGIPTSEDTIQSFPQAQPSIVYAVWVLVHDNVLERVVGFGCTRLPLERRVSDIG